MPVLFFIDFLYLLFFQNNFLFEWVIFMININQKHIVFTIVVVVATAFFVNNLFRTNKYTYVLNKKFYRNINEYILDANNINYKFSHKEFQSYEELLTSLEKEKLKFIPLEFILKNILEKETFSLEELYLPKENQMEILLNLRGNSYKTHEKLILDTKFQDDNFIRIIQLMKIEKPSIVDYFSHFLLFLAVITVAKLFFINYIFDKD